MSNGLLDGQEIEIDCPNCNKEIKITIGSGKSSVICPHCKQEISIDDTNLTDALKDAENMLDDLLDGLFKSRMCSIFLVIVSICASKPFITPCSRLTSPLSSTV